jgi:hypothetical protein
MLLVLTQLLLQLLDLSALLGVDVRLLGPPLKDYTDRVLNVVDANHSLAWSNP